MPDITMCHGAEVPNVEGAEPRLCSLREQCYRHTAIPTPRRQAYFAGLPIRQGETCHHYWPAGKDKP